MKISLLGVSFNIETNDNPDYIKKIVDIYSSKIENVKSFTSTKESLKIAIIAGLLVSDQYLKQKEALEKEKEKEKIAKKVDDESDKLISSLIHEIDDRFLQIEDDEG